MQPNLLKAAAKQNAESIAKLQAERAALVTTQNDAGRADRCRGEGDRRPGRRVRQLVGEIATADDVADQAEADKATLAAAIAAASTELTTLQGQRTTLVNQITPLQTQLTAAAERAGRPEDRRRPASSAASPTKEADLAAAKTRLDSATAAATTAQNKVNAQVAAIETATQELAGLVAQGDAAQALVDAAEKKLADARAALPGLEATAKTADTNAAAATAAVVKAEENLRLAEQSVHHPHPADQHHRGQAARRCRREIAGLQGDIATKNARDRRQAGRDRRRHRHAGTSPTVDRAGGRARPAAAELASPTSNDNAVKQSLQDQIHELNRQLAAAKSAGHRQDRADHRPER